MCQFRQFVITGALFVLLGGASAAPPEVRVKVVKYAELGNEVRQHRGQVVVVDFWSDTCIPCKKRFPDLVKFSRAHAAQGLVVISVNVDPNSQKKEVQDKALKFLQAMNATFLNLMLDEPANEWSDKLGIKSLPAVFVFDREGRWRKFTEGATHEDVEKQAIEWLNQKTK